MVNYSQGCASVFWEDPDVLMGLKENCPELVLWEVGVEEGGVGRCLLTSSYHLQP